jgi:hypothetical protein
MNIIIFAMQATIRPTNKIPGFSEKTEMREVNYSKNPEIKKCSEKSWNPAKNVEIPKIPNLPIKSLKIPQNS